MAILAGGVVAPVLLLMGLQRTLGSTATTSTTSTSPYRLDWASLLKRVFGVDVLQCSRCQGKMRLIACIEEPDVAKKILVHLGLPSESLPTARAQAPPVTLELFPEA